MKIDVNERRENALLEREEISLSIDHTGDATPSKDAVRRQLAAELDLDPQTIEVDHIYSPAGSAHSTARVTVHDEPIMDELPDEEPDADPEEAEEEETEDDGGDADEEADAESPNEDVEGDEEADEDETKEGDD